MSDLSHLYLCLLVSISDLILFFTVGDVDSVRFASDPEVLGTDIWDALLKVAFSCLVYLSPVNARCCLSFHVMSVCTSRSKNGLPSHFVTAHISQLLNCI